MSAPERIWIDPTFIDSPRMVPVLSGKLMTAKPDRKLPTDVEYRRADLPPTDAEVMNHPKVRALVEALIRIQDLTQHNMPMTAQEEQCVYREARAALAAIQEAKP